jgi:hypothetical protein
MCINHTSSNKCSIRYATSGFIHRSIACYPFRRHYYCAVNKCPCHHGRNTIQLLSPAHCDHSPCVHRYAHPHPEFNNRRPDQSSRRYSTYLRSNGTDLQRHSDHNPPDKHKRRHGHHDRYRWISPASSWDSHFSPTDDTALPSPF